MKLKVFILFQLMLLFCFSCTKQPVKVEEPRRVKSVAVVFRELPDEAAGFGNLSFMTKTDIASPQDAVISKLYFREGDYVTEGAKIILLENPQINLAVERAQNNYSQALAAYNLSKSRLLEGIFQAEAQLLALEKAEIELNLAKRNLEEGRRKHHQQETLFQAGGIHSEAILASRFNLDTELEQIKLMERELDIRRIGRRDSDLKTAGIPVPLDEKDRKNAFILLITSTLRAELEAAQANLDASEKELFSANIALQQLTITSPVSGEVGVRYLEEGERVRVQDKILTVINSSSLYAIFPIREKEAVRTEKGMKASVFVDGVGESYDGVVDLVYPQADSQTLSFLVRVLLENIGGSNKIRPGMFARITVVLGQPRKVLCIPESAIFNQRNNEGSVFVINGSALASDWCIAERKITLGQSHGEEREITGLNMGEIIVQNPDMDLREGDYVSIID